MRRRRFRPPIKLPDGDILAGISKATKIPSPILGLREPNERGGFVSVTVAAHHTPEVIGRVSIKFGEFWPNKTGRILMTILNVTSDALSL